MVQVFLIVVGASLSLFVMMWLVVYLGQFLRPDRPIPPHRDHDLMRRVLMKAGKSSTVHFSDIRMLEKDRVLVGVSEQDYSYYDGFSSGWPESWEEDLLKRRN